MLFQDPQNRRREGSASPLRIIATLVGILAVVALAGWGVFAFAGALVGPPAPAPQDVSTPVVVQPPATSTSGAETTDSTALATSAAAAAVAAAPTLKTAPTPAPKAAPAPKTVTPTASKYVVVIDAGHQGAGNNTPEPVGPGASQTKPAVADGAAGVSTRRRESLVNLEVSKRIRTLLEARGVQVIMIRTSENVNITNAERAQIANRAKADLLLRIHCDSVSNRSLSGLLTLVPGKNQWTGPIVAPSARAGKAIHAATLASTGAKNRGITPRTDMSGFNWAAVPAVIVEMGMMSNPAEDKLLSTPAYQDKLAQGISAGVMTYLSAK
jgi:N-acetylmuramoyl-L-alanine amidase